jgi:V/A-type H+-transporting ATPase subunit C
MASPIDRYAFINAKLRARISKILPDEFVDRLLRAHSLVEAVGFFRDTEFSYVETVYTKTGDLKSIELELYKHEIRLYMELERYARAEVLRFVKALANAFEIDNLKNTLRLWFNRTVRKRDISVPYLYLYKKKIHHDLKLDSIIASDSIEEIASVLVGTPYSSVIRKAAQWVNEHSSIFLAEVLLDKFFYKTLGEEFKFLRGKDVDIAKRFIGVEIDLQNIGWLIRFKTMYNLPVDEAFGYTVPFGCVRSRERVSSVYQARTVQEMLSGLLRKCYPGLDSLFATQAHDAASQFVTLERVLQQIMMYEISRSISGYPFTIGIVLAYFILKRNEIKRIVTILNAKYYGAHEETVRAKL